MTGRVLQRLGLVGVLCSAACWVEYSLEDTAETEPTGNTEADALDCAGQGETFEVCVDACVDTEAAQLHCGGCGIECGADEVCAGGVCVFACDCDPQLEVYNAGACECREGFERCGEDCVQTVNDPSHCGGCNNDCGDEFCIEDECVDQCGLLAECSGACTDFDIDPLNCGDCGNVCESDELCAFGVCRYFEPFAPEECDECPCEGACEDAEEGLTCCYSELLDLAVCLDTPVCP